MTRAFNRQKPISKTAASTAARIAAYDSAPKSGPNDPKTRPVYVRYAWDDEKDCLVVNRRYFFTPTKTENGWHVLGSIDEIEARENAGQRSMF